MDFDIHKSYASIVIYKIHFSFCAQTYAYAYAYSCVRVLVQLLIFKWTQVFLFIELFIDHVKRKKFEKQKQIDANNREGEAHGTYWRHDVEHKLTRDMREVCSVCLLLSISK